MSLNVPGFVARSPELARELSHPCFAAGARSHGPVSPEDRRWSRAKYERECAADGVLLLRMDAGGVPHHLVLEAIRLLGTEVVPRVRSALG